MKLPVYLDEFINSEVRLPSPAQQSINAVRFIGDEIRRSFEPIPSLSPDFQAIIGAPSRDYSLKLIRELADRGILSAKDSKSQSSRYNMIQVDLTLDGWELYENEQRGEVSSRYGFIALQFGDKILDPFLSRVIKPGLKISGYDIVDIRDVSKAGIIDNILRAQIRDSAFVLVDLTHDNPGAYWEAGYAEGIGKPVIYICEQSKFDQKKTHFDTNHCTTVMWDVDNPEKFLDQLGATIRRSLDFA